MTNLTKDSGLPTTNYRLPQIFFWLLGGILLWLAFRGQDFVLIGQELQKVDYRWGIPVLLASLLGHVSRAMRWKLLLLPLKNNEVEDKNLALGNVWWAMMFGYLVNLGVPRLGEVSRCVAIQKSEDISFESTLGTVVAERAIDIFCLFLLLVFTFFYQFDIAASFLKTYVFLPFRQLFIEKQFALYLLLGFAVLGVLLLWLLWKALLKLQWFAKVRNFATEVFKGLLSIRHMPQRRIFLLHTFLIWLSYFFMTYCWFFAIPATQNLGVQGGLFLLVLGSIGKSVPIQGGGMGAYHFLVTKGLSLSPFLIAAVPALTLATIIHLTQTLFYLFVGSIAAVVVLYKNRRTQKKSD